MGLNLKKRLKVDILYIKEVKNMLKTIISKRGNYTLGVDGCYFLGFISEEESRIGKACYEVLICEDCRIKAVNINLDEIIYIIKY